MPRYSDKQRSLRAAQRYVNHYLPDLCGQPLDIHVLDGPPDAPRYAVAVEACVVRACPHGFSASATDGKRCDVLDCPLRRSARLLLDRDGDVRHATISGIHWK